MGWAGLLIFTFRELRYTCRGRQCGARRARPPCWNERRLRSGVLRQACQVLLLKRSPSRQLPVSERSTTSRTAFPHGDVRVHKHPLNTNIDIGCSTEHHKQPSFFSFNCASKRSKPTSVALHHIPTSRFPGVDVRQAKVGGLRHISSGCMSFLSNSRGPMRRCHIMPHQDHFAALPCGME